MVSFVFYYTIESKQCNASNLPYLSSSFALMKENVASEVSTNQCFIFCIMQLAPFLEQ